MEEVREYTQIEWSGIQIEITFTRNWLSGTSHHLELRANEPLSVTATGYRSHFFPAEPEMDFEFVIHWVVTWLAEEVASREWQDYLEQQRQGDLFDL